MSPPIVEIVVPCYNEAERLNGALFMAWLAVHPHYRLRFVNDGSTDATWDCLEALVKGNPGQVRVIHLQLNGGKAEAVRRGLLEVLDAGEATYMGYFDADRSTPLEELTLLVEVLEARPGCKMALGSRVLLMGRDIRRNPARHYLGRVFATLASLVLDLPVYDTQCGAKVMRVGPDWSRLLAFPFVTRWVFDVELISRLMRWERSLRPDGDRGRHLVEMPLRQWVDVQGSKVKPIDGLIAFVDLVRLYYLHRRPWPEGI